MWVNKSFVLYKLLFLQQETNGNRLVDSLKQRIR